jgi:type IV pilus assembly protein PilC
MPRFRTSSLWRNWLGLIGWAMLVLILLGLFGGALYFLGISPPIPYLPFCFALMVAAVAHARATARKRRINDILAYLEQAVRLNLPLPAMLGAAARNESRLTARRLDRLRTQLEQGGTLAASLAEAVPEMPEITLQKVAAAEHLGQLQPTLARLTARHGPSAAPPEQVAFYKAYPPAMLLVLAIVVGIIVMFVMPKFEAIFRDFHATLPPVTQLLLAVTQNQWFQETLCVLAVIWIGQLLAQMLAPRHRPFFGNLLHGVYFRVPILHRHILDRGMADLCQTTAGAVRASWPLDQALREAAGMQDNALLRRRVDRWAAQIGEGVSISDAARGARLPRLIAAMLAPVRSGDELAQALAFLARHYQTRVERARILLRAAYIPIVVTLMGICVGFVAMSLMMPLAHLIQSIDFSTGYQ